MAKGRGRAVELEIHQATLSSRIRREGFLRDGSIDISGSKITPPRQRSLKLKTGWPNQIAWCGTAEVLDRLVFGISARELMNFTFRVSFRDCAYAMQLNCLFVSQ